MTNLERDLKDFARLEYIVQSWKLEPEPKFMIKIECFNEKDAENFKKWIDRYYPFLKDYVSYDYLIFS